MGSPPLVYDAETGGWLSVGSFIIAIKEHDTLFKHIMSLEWEMAQNSYGKRKQHSACWTGVTQPFSSHQTGKGHAGTMHTLTPL